MELTFRGEGFWNFMTGIMEQNNYGAQKTKPTRKQVFIDFTSVKPPEMFETWYNRTESVLTED